MPIFILQMKRKILVWFAGAVFAALSVGTAVSQPYTTTWPYLYSDFRDGIICMKDGGKLSCRVNVHLLNGRLHYLDGETVKEALSANLSYVLVGQDKFVSVDGDIMRVEAESRGGFVAVHMTGDFDSVMAGEGAYGMTANTESVTQLSSLDIQKGINANHMLLLEEKDQGQEFDLRKEYYLVAADMVWPAYRGDILKALPDDRRDAFKSFLRNNKIKWDNPDRLILLVDFLADGNK